MGAGLNAFGLNLWSRILDVPIILTLDPLSEDVFPPARMETVRGPNLKPKTRRVLFAVEDGFGAGAGDEVVERGKRRNLLNKCITDRMMTSLLMDELRADESYWKDEK